MNSAVQKLGLGAAQFRFEQQAHPRARSPHAEISDILAIAQRAGVGMLDAAVPYDSAEIVLGGAIPAGSPFGVLVRAARPERGPDHVEFEARASLRRLGLTSADAIIIQSAGDLFGRHGPELWDKLQDLKDQGLFARIGVAALACDDPVGIAKRFRPDIIQAPASILDQRLLANGALAEVAAMGVEVHLRSIFLQGLLFLPPDRMPAPLKGAASSLSRVRRMIAEGRSDPMQAALGFALARKEASAVIVGASTAQELSALVAAAASPPPDLDWDRMALDDENALDHRWAAA
jgi:aryl-alcohol dehydrogenase-like predicted oxidoreductase